MDFEQICNHLQKELSPKRYMHSLAVSEEAIKLAKRYGADLQKSKMAGILHDCAKMLPYEELMRLCGQYGIFLSEEDKLQPKILHGFVGAFLMKERYGADDADIFDAVYYHTTGKPDMPLLSKIIFLADYIEPNRESEPHIVKLRSLSYENIDEAMILGLDCTILHLIQTGALICDLSLRARNYYICQKKGAAAYE